jgi:hypothetical protein
MKEATSPLPTAHKSRPRSVTVISWIFIAAGSVGLLYHSSEVLRSSRIELGMAVVLLIRLVAIVAGVFMLRGASWARWLLVVWMAYHIVLSAFHSVGELAMHAVLFGTISIFLFRPGNCAYFRCLAKKLRDAA